MGANSPLSVSPICLCLLMCVSCSDRISSHVARRPLSSLRRSFPKTRGYRWVLWRRAVQEERWQSGGIHRQEWLELLQAVKQGCAELPHRLQDISIQQRPHALPQQPLAAEFCPDGSEHSTAGGFGRLKTPAASPWHTPRRDAARPGRRCAHSCRLAFSAAIPGGC